MRISDWSSDVCSSDLASSLSCSSLVKSCMATPLRIGFRGTQHDAVADRQGIEHQGAAFAVLVWEERPDLGPVGLGAVAGGLLDAVGVVERRLGGFAGCRLLFHLRLLGFCGCPEGRALPTPRCSRP